MIIVKPDIASQQIEVYTRDHTGEDYTVQFINEQTNKSTTESVTGAYNGTSFVFDTTYQFSKERWYMAKLYSGEILINHSKVYCTDQADFEKYSVLDGYYHQIDKPKHEFITKK